VRLVIKDRLLLELLVTWLSPAAPAPRALPILDIQNARAWSPGPKPCAKAAPVRAAKAGAARGALTGCCRVRRGLSPGDGCPLADAGGGDAGGGPVGDAGGEPGGDARSPLKVRLKLSHAAVGRYASSCAVHRTPRLKRLYGAAADVPCAVCEMPCTPVVLGRRLPRRAHRAQPACCALGMPGVHMPGCGRGR